MYINSYDYYNKILYIFEIKYIYYKLLNNLIINYYYYYYHYYYYHLNYLNL